MFQNAIEILFSDRHSAYVLSAYLIFILALIWLVVNGIFQTRQLQKNIIAMDELRARKQSKTTPPKIQSSETI